MRPAVVTDEHLEFLDELRLDGSVNMFGARPILQENFGLTKDESATIHSYWMDSFGNPDR